MSRRDNRASRATVPITLAEILSNLKPLEKEFFEALDHELEKVDRFYQDREREWIFKLSVIKGQLRELQEHRQLFRATRRNDEWVPVPRVLIDLVGRAKAGTQSKGTSTPAGTRSRATSRPASVAPANKDPDDYQHAKRKLKKAVREFYRGLELLKNYRIMNLTGFRKAIKKYEKTTKTAVQEPYMKEKVELCAFSSGQALDAIMKEVEDLYASTLEGGDRKKATARLRTLNATKSHHFSTFRTGSYLGLSIPPLIEGLYIALRADTQATMHEWSALLCVYSVFFIPSIFSLLISLNLLGWTRARINHSFIFELGAKAIDSRKYAELPAFLFLTLCYAFWLSFTRPWGDSVSPTIWPMAWLGLVFVFMLDPLPIFFRKSRFWLLRTIAKMPLSAFHRVEFTDFWLGDQFCSLTYPLANLYFVGCAYRDHFDDPWERCSAVHEWVTPFCLSALPALARFAQCMKRYLDSRSKLQLINAGKYSFSIMQLASYYLWRHGGSASDASFIVVCIISALTSIYTCSWDLLMDWSIFQRHGGQYPFLRAELLYSRSIVYYFAIISNIAIRFVWVIYLPAAGPSVPVRSFIASMLEMLRRFQWNFFRLENEHIGNADQYRVTREVPLPYSFGDDIQEEESDGEDAHADMNERTRMRKTMRLSTVARRAQTSRTSGEGSPGNDDGTP